MTQAVIYARVSSKEQAEEGFSIPAQLKLLREYAATQGFKVAEEFVEVETAKRAGRTEFGAMVEFLRRRRKTCRAVIAEKTDRLYRNFRDCVTVDDLGVDVHFAKEGVVLSQDSQSHEKLVHDLKVVLAKNYIDNLAEETRKGMVEKAAQGTYPSYAPLGYVNVESNSDRKLDLDPDRAPVIRRMFEWYAGGDVSLAEVRRRAIEAGFRTRRGKHPTRSTVSDILKNPIHTGHFLWKGKLHEGDHPATIGMDLFQRAQQAFGKDGKPASKPKRVFAYAGLVKCAKCGCAVTAERKKGQYTYYHCTGGRGDCPKPYIREEQLEGMLGDLVQAIAIDEETLGWITAALKESHHEEKEFHAAQVAALERQAALTQERLDAIYEDKLDGKISEEFWERKSGEWRQKQVEARAAIERHERANQYYFEDGIRVLSLAHRAYDLWLQQPQAEKRKLLNLLLSNCTFDGENLSATYRKPFGWLAEGSQCTDWLPAYPQNPNFSPAA